MATYSHSQAIVIEAGGISIGATPGSGEYYIVTYLLSASQAGYPNPSASMNVYFSTGMTVPATYVVNANGGTATYSFNGGVAFRNTA